MTRLIDNPADEPVVSVDRSVLVSMLGRLGMYADELGKEREVPYYRLANEVESGERGSLTAAEWAGERAEFVTVNWKALQCAIGDIANARNTGDHEAIRSAWRALDVVVGRVE